MFSGSHHEGPVKKHLLTYLSLYPNKSLVSRRPYKTETKQKVQNLLGKNFLTHNTDTCTNFDHISSTHIRKKTQISAASTMIAKTQGNIKASDYRNPNKPCLTKNPTMPSSFHDPTTPSSFPIQKAFIPYLKAESVGLRSSPTTKCFTTLIPSVTQKNRRVLVPAQQCTNNPKPVRSFLQKKMQKSRSKDPVAVERPLFGSDLAPTTDPISSPVHLMTTHPPLDPHIPPATAATTFNLDGSNLPWNPGLINFNNHEKQGSLLRTPMTLTTDHPNKSWTLTHWSPETTNSQVHTTSPPFQRFSWNDVKIDPTPNYFSQKQKPNTQVSKDEWFTTSNRKIHTQLPITSSTRYPHDFGHLPLYGGSDKPITRS